MESEMLQSPLLGLGEEDEADLTDWNLPLAFMKKRHCEKIEGSKSLAQSWRMKDRMKTVSVALVLCLNVGVDPPDVVKTTPCARLECWIDPLSMGPQKALETIGANLQKQYENWQPRARYKQSLDPTVDEVKKLCTSLRRNAKEERVLFHYNGHGVPRPTVNGEVWVFNKNYTQYIPLSIYDLQTWMGSPSIFVYDCSNAGLIVKSFKQFALQREQELEVAAINPNHPLAQMPLPPSMKNCIQLAACEATELLPMIPDLPADLFTSCLTTPIKIALRWFCMQKCVSLVPGVTLDLIEKIPGRLNDRRTPLGELNWIFTAITDTIAWNVLPRDLFQKLFRQDLLVASLFRNFLLAERIMRSYNCTPVSSPRLPPTYMHAMWQAWDLAVDICLSQLPTIIEEGTAFRHSPFFAEQLTAFQVWLTMGVENRNPPEQLPIVLQVLLSQVHRLRALDLLGRFLDLGPWAVSLALSVGIFPYVLKLLQSSARELRPLLVFIWAKILAVDSSCQADLVKDNGHKYFLSVLADPYMPAEHRTMTAFILAVIVNSYNTGQEACLQGNLIAICLEQLNDPHPLLRQWVAICLGRIWQNFDSARWCGVRDSAHEKLYSLLSDPIPEVRCAAVFALGTFVGNSAERTDHSTTIDHNVAMMLAQLVSDGSPMVRKELVVALSHLVVQYESNFCTVALQFIEEEKNYPLPSPATTEGGSLTPVRDSPCTPRLRSVSSYGNIRAVATARSLNKSLQNLSLTEESGGAVAFSPGNLSTSSSASSTLGSPENEEHILSFETIDKMRRASSYSSLNSLIGVSFNSVYTQIWRVLLHLAADPYPEVSDVAMKVLNSIAYKATVNARPQRVLDTSSLTQSAPASPTNKGVHIHQAGGSPPASSTSSSSLTNDVAKQPVSRDLPSGRPGTTGPAGAQYTPHSHQFPRTRKMFDKGPEQTADDADDAAGHKSFISATVQTGFCDWSARYFAQPVMKIPEEHDLESQIRKEREWRFLRNSRVRRQAQQVIQKGITRLDDQIFLNRNPGVPSVVKFHPFTPCIAVADKDSICFWDWEKGEKLDYFHNGNPRYTRVTAMEYLNGQDCSLLLTATDDGAIRVWKNFADLEKNPEMVTAWQGLSDMLPTTRGAGMVVDWEQETGLLMSSGDVRIVRIWDTDREMKVQDIPTGADSCVTSLSCDSHRSLIVAGLGDGSIRVYDRRMALSECRVMTYREHTAWVVKASLQKRPDGHIVSVSVNGDVRIFDPRMPESVNVLQIVKGLTALDIHPQADLIACGSVNQFTAIYNGGGELINNIKYYDGFMGQRVGAISCLAFHPHWPHLAVGSNDYYISVYSVEKRVR
ncbi:regulatory-associated protein of mTOR isoform X1 [Chlorocebus sabaeus]|uniref:Regulatory-associated protein of mTOR n=8 Tax=Cercopithecidae TaxID=9527 RepID=H9EN45_MACMU|nr:regulatory-associated protein of mTOR isoform X1 [Papio anubis]XP_005585267.1 regulatory-associated protein of mTOR [Macaca fascicularis]XP_008011389.1 regulatory-associated protein of mTOR isoform X2 [Chlorocebus sabaeus]XP_011718447.1 regulatory-associated protein of mTOR isoform X2 [Macaca nemestrina]XP_011921594.1 PREDICTED: regulatory-associated protein of mTOR isoform X1 [Cercocebus atys]XP_014976006.1 regulatory-associated protein of mTOR isoform X1 [Macaca mulatta]XP_025218324.1 re